MKLQHIHIEAYKVFRDFNLDFCLSGDDTPQSLIVITGVNGNGKTTLLKEIIAEKDSARLPSSCITIEEQGTSRTFLLPIFPSDEGYRNTFSKVRLYAADDKSLVACLEKEIIRYVDKFVYEQGRTSFEAYTKIQNLIEDIFQGFGLQIRFEGINRDKELIFTNQNGEKFGIDGLSSGERQILTKVFSLFTEDVKGNVILIDEPESSLHPSWQARLIPILRRCAKNNDCQIILATHSPQIISSVHQDELRVFVRNEEGYVQSEICSGNPYGWTVEKVLGEIQGVEYLRVPDVEDSLDELRRMIKENKWSTEEFKRKLSALEILLGYSEPDLVLIRMEVIRKSKGI